MDHDVTVALSTSADDATRKNWFGDYHLLFCATFGEQLRLEIIVTNRGTSSLPVRRSASFLFFALAMFPAPKLRGLNGASFHRQDRRQARKAPARGRRDLWRKPIASTLRRFSTVEIRRSRAARRRLLVAKEELDATPSSGIPGPKKRRRCPTSARMNGASLSVWKPATSVTTPSILLPPRRTRCPP